MLRVAITIVRRIVALVCPATILPLNNVPTWNVLYPLVIAGNEVRGDENEGMASCLPIFVPFTSSFLARQVSSSYRYLSLVSIRTTRGNLAARGFYEEPAVEIDLKKKFLGSVLVT